jgi:hypothetical protein
MLFNSQITYSLTPRLANMVHHALRGYVQPQRYRLDQIYGTPTLQAGYIALVYSLDFLKRVDELSLIQKKKCGFE